MTEREERKIEIVDGQCAGQYSESNYILINRLPIWCDQHCCGVYLRGGKWAMLLWSDI